MRGFDNPLLEMISKNYKPKFRIGYGPSKTRIRSHTLFPFCKIVALT